MDTIKDYYKNLYASIPFWWIVLVILCVEVVSFAGHNFDIVETAAFAAIVALTFVYSLRNLKIGVFILITELFIGSKGYLFAVDIGSFSVSIRLALFLTVFAAYLIWLIRDRRIEFFRWSLWKEYSLVIVLIVVGVVIGVLRGNELTNIFLDTNGYLYFGLIGPYTQAIKSRDDSKQAIALLFAGMTALGIKTLVILAMFSQISVLEFTLPGIYRWIRDTGVGEITRFENGFSRIFFQSHFYMIVPFFFVLAHMLLIKTKTAWKNKTVLSTVALFGLSMLVLFLSYSRSFWAGLAGTIIVGSLWLLIRRKVTIKRLIIVGAICIAVFAIDYAIAFGLVNIPLPGNVGVGASSLLIERTQNISDEPAAATRWQSLDPLMDAALEHPLIGSGLGKTVTYISSDPRVLEESPDGSYTTFAFEWGYLDLFLKYGIVGLLIYAMFFIELFRKGLKQIQSNKQQPIEVVGFILVLLAMLAINVFTPYLNHPLGIGLIIMASLALTL
ncbi:MAG: O-antigen ligase family protein [Candidatus Kerfeldbacteria bacterium]